VFGWFKKWRRDRIARQPFPSRWRAIIEANVPYYRLLPGDDRVELLRHVRIFLAEKRFEGVQGFVVTDEVRLTIAAMACVLLLHRTTNYFSGLKTIIIYPGSFVSSHVERFDSGFELIGPETRLGEAWHRGPILLSWPDVQEAMGETTDGSNVVYHEFTHHLDWSVGRGEGSRIFDRRKDLKRWLEVLSREYLRLQKDVQRGRDTFLDDYGAESPAEFFAVVTECFFEMSRDLRDHHPELYEQLKIFYHQDPAALMENLPE